MPDTPLSDTDVEAVLAGRQPIDRADYEAVAEWVARLREESRAQSPPTINARLRAQIDEHAISSTSENAHEPNDEAIAEVTPIGVRSGAELSEVSQSDPRTRRTVVSVAAAVIMVLGVVAGARLVGDQDDEPDVRSRPFTEQPIEHEAPTADPDVPAEGESKKPPPLAERDPVPEPADDGRSQSSGDRGSRGDEWLEQYCESLTPPHGSGGPGRDGSGRPPGPPDPGGSVCGPGASNPSPPGRNP